MAILSAAMIDNGGRVINVIVADATKDTIPGATLVDCERLPIGAKWIWQTRWLPPKRVARLKSNIIVELLHLRRDEGVPPGFIQVSDDGSDKAWPGSIWNGSIFSQPIGRGDG